jgi:hypothetical protein
VGFCKPPKATRFQPGQSGNLKGRPKKKRNPDEIFLSKPVQAALRDEFLRPLTLADGTQVPALRAVARAAVASAVKGSAQAQRTVLQYGEGLELRFHKERAENFKQAYLLRERFQELLNNWIASGRPGDEFPAHPADIEIDEVTGELRILGPACLNRDEVIAGLLKVRDHSQAVVLRNVQINAEGSGDVFTDFGRYASQITFDLANEYLPPRLRRELVGRIPPGTPKPMLARGLDVAARLRQMFEKRIPD